MISKLETGRVADVLAEMDPGDAADLIKDLPEAVAEGLPEHMKPEDAPDACRLLAYGEFTTGGIITPEPVVLGTNATVVEALARIREGRLTLALASMVFVTRPPLGIPLGRYVGAVHFQQLLRAIPTLMVVTMIGHNLEPLSPDSPLVQVSRLFAIYNLVVAPVVGSDGVLVEAVTVDDALGRTLPDDWHETQMDRSVKVSHG